MSEVRVESSIEACFGELYDARVQGRCAHKLIDIVTTQPLESLVE
jgi:hypothetical protein